MKTLANRRAFMTSALAAFAVAPESARCLQAPEIPNYRADVPQGATLWSLVVFTGDEPAEVSVSAGEATQTLKGRFGGQRLVEYSWRNTSRTTQRVLPPERPPLVTQRADGLCATCSRQLARRDRAITSRADLSV